MVIGVPLPSETNDSEDRFGFDQNRSYISEFLNKFVPQSLARRSIAVYLETDRRHYERDDPVELTIEFQNRLPVPVGVVTPKQRLWGWSIDGIVEASDRQVYTRARPATFSFRPREVKRVHRRWHGRIKRTDGEETRWMPPSPGEYEIEAFVALAGRQPSDSVTIKIR